MLGEQLLLQRRFAEAVSPLQRAAKLDPKDFKVNQNLGIALLNSKRYAEAADAFRATLALKPVYTGEVLASLGSALAQQKQDKEALAVYRQAVRARFMAKSTRAEALVFLGILLYRLKQYDEALVALNGALDLDPTQGRAHSQIGAIHLARHQFDKALAGVKRALKVLSPDHPEYSRLLPLEKIYIQFLALERKRVNVLAGKEKPTTAKDLVEMASFCQVVRQRLGEALPFYEAAFAAEPRLVGPNSSYTRLDAAWCAAVVATGQEPGTEKHDEKERARVRKLALEWLTGEKEAGRVFVEKGPDNFRRSVGRMLAMWQDDERLAPLRQASSLANLPDAERDAWQRFWADVATLRRQIEQR
jgi:tetratricopeptide (TPR) repeat protein